MIREKKRRRRTKKTNKRELTEWPIFRHEVKGLYNDIVEHIREELSEGREVELPKIALFRVGLRVKDFHSRNRKANGTFAKTPKVESSDEEEIEKVFEVLPLFDLDEE